MRFVCMIGLHSDREQGAGSSIHRYYECRYCKRRAFIKARKGYQPIREGWLKGGAWDGPTPMRPPRAPPMRDERRWG